ncbi:hypothetical protein, partial [Streptomyces pseudoechinosporeus]
MTDNTAEDLERAAVRHLLDQTLAWTMERLGAHIGAIYLAEPGGEVLSLEVASGAPPEWAKKPYLNRSWNAWVEQVSRRG